MTPRKQEPKPLQRGSNITFKISENVTDKEIDYLNEKREANEGGKYSIFASLFFEKVREEMAGRHKIVLPLDRELTPEERKKLDDPVVRGILKNVCLALLNDKIPTAEGPKDEEGNKSKIDERTRKKANAFLNQALAFGKNQT